MVSNEEMYSDDIYSRKNGRTFFGDKFFCSEIWNALEIGIVLIASITKVISDSVNSPRDIS